MVSPDDTQPRSPFKVPPQPHQPAEPQLLDEPASPGGPGCLVWGTLGIFVVGLAVVIMALSALAGWTSGLRTAQTNATATQSAAINEQLSRIPADISGGNWVLLQARLRYLSTLTPAVPGLDGHIQTATSVYLTRQPSPTATASPTVAATTPAPTAAQPTLAATSDSGFDLAALLEQARSAVAVRDWDEAIDLLDVLMAADSTFETAAVRSLMSEALTTQAYELFRAGDNGDLAEAIILADRAAQFGDIGDLAYERYIASLYLDALNTIGTNYPAAIQALSEVYNQVPNYRDVTQLLFSQYLAYGDAWVAQSEFCPAVGQYQNALNIQSSGGVSAKRDNAQTMCSQATPVGSAPTTLTPGAPQPIAPVGQPGT